MITFNPYVKWMTAGKLADLLKQVPSDSIVLVNDVRNLWVGKPSDHPENSEMLGYIDFAGEEFDDLS